MTADTSSSTAIELRIDPRSRPVGTGQVQRLLPFRQRRMVGPFIFVDLIGPETLTPGAGIDIDAHPHIGLSTLTYLFQGRMVHRDSTGAVQTIEPGAVNWMTAGAGVTHTERSLEADRTTTRPLHGMQIWVALPTELEDGAASFEHLAASDLSAEQRGASTVRVAVGSAWGVDSPIAGSSPMVLADLELVDGSPIPVDRSLREVAVVVIEGEATVNDEALVAGQLAVLRPDVASELAGQARVMLLGGDPVGPRHIWWNFVSSDPDRIEAAKTDWAAQRFPLVPGDHQSFVPLPS
ncbi:MAG: pirin family protein [Acidimicrobiales bacterium]